MNILKVNHIGVRAGNAKRAVDFYRYWGFEVILEVDFDAATIMKNAHGVELNLITNGVDPIGGKNIVMDVPEKYPPLYPCRAAGGFDFAMSCGITAP